MKLGLGIGITKGGKLKRVRVLTLGGKALLLAGKVLTLKR
jgi:hypothetical protein